MDRSLWWPTGEEFAPPAALACSADLNYSKHLQPQEADPVQRASQAMDQREMDQWEFEIGWGFGIRR